MSRCSYEWRPEEEGIDELRESSVLNERSRCSLESHKNSEKCILHLDKSIRDQKDISDEMVRDKFLECINSENRQDRILIGINLPDIKLKVSQLTPPDNSFLFIGKSKLGKINLAGSEIDTRIMLDRNRIEEIKVHTSDINSLLSIEKCTLGNIEASFSKFREKLLLRNCKVKKGDFKQTEISKGEFIETAFEENINFASSELGNVKFTDSKFNQKAIFTSAKFEEAHFHQTEFNEKANFVETTFKQAGHFSEAKFNDQAIFAHSSFITDAQFIEADFNGFCEFMKSKITDGDFRGAQFKEESNFRECDFKGRTTFQKATFEKDASFINSILERADFTGVQFNQDVDFMNTRFEKIVEFSVSEDNLVKPPVSKESLDDLDLNSAELQTRFEGETNFTNAIFESNAVFIGSYFNTVKLVQCNFNENLLMQDSEIKTANFTGSKCESGHFNRTRFLKETNLSGVKFKELYMHDCYFREDVDLIGSKITQEAHIEPKTDRDQIIFDFSSSNIGSGFIKIEEEDNLFVNLTDAKLEDFKLEKTGNILDKVKILRTSFENFDFSLHAEELSQRNWDLHNTQINSNKIETEDLENTYLKAKNGAVKSGSQEAASNFYFKQMKLRRRRYIEEAKNEDLQISKRVSNGSEAIKNTIFNLTSGYGVRPGRVIISSTAIVIFFSFLYYLTSLASSSGSLVTRIGENGPLTEYLLLSIESFTTMMLPRTPETVESTTRLLSATEAFLGAFMIAMFVYTLSKSLDLP